jgi:hypothetical protein
LRESGHSPTAAGTSVSHAMLGHVGWLISLVLVVVCTPALPGFSQVPSSLLFLLQYLFSS